MQESVSVEGRVAVGVWWMAYQTIEQQFCLASSTVAGIVLEIAQAIMDILLQRVICLWNPDRAPADMDAGIEVPVGGSGDEESESEDEDDLWSKHLDVLERGQLHLQNRLEEAMRAIPEMVIRALAAE
ncbi:UNVERIFIED_CONTAM: hypothetical protein K2H54_015956 [Gekko kuhli]